MCMHVATFYKSGREVHFDSCGLLTVSQDKVLLLNKDIKSHSISLEGLKKQVMYMEGCTDIKKKYA